MCFLAPSCATFPARRHYGERQRAFVKFEMRIKDACVLLLAVIIFVKWQRDIVSLLYFFRLVRHILLFPFVFRINNPSTDYMTSPHLWYDHHLSLNENVTLLVIISWFVSIFISFVRGYRLIDWSFQTRLRDVNLDSYLHNYNYVINDWFMVNIRVEKDRF